METKHTPGPWRQIGWGPNVRILSGNEVICDVGCDPDCDPDRDRANATLITTAPELLEALKVAWDLVEPGAGSCATREEQKQIRDAIAKAEGRLAHKGKV